MFNQATRDIPDDDRDWSRDSDGELLIGGQPLSRVVATAGGTPCYVYDRQRMTDRVRQLRAGLDRRIRVYYAVKANPMPALVCHLAREVDGMDVASAGELRVALDSGVPAGDISFAGPGKSEAELEQAASAGATINLESFREMDLLEKFHWRTGIAPRIAIRVNLPFELRASGMRMTGGPKQFGVDAEQVPELMRRISDGGMIFEGFHLYAGSQNLDADAIVEAQVKSYECVLEWLEGSDQKINSINLGGGFGIPYTSGDRPLELNPVVENLNALAARAARDLPDTRLVLELGRYLVGEAGLYVCKVVDRKQSQGKTFLITDGGMHHHLAATGNFGQVIRRNYPLTINKGGAATEKVDIVGPLCTPLDLLGKDVTVHRAGPGDLVVLFQSGAYGRTVSPSRFLSHPESGEALV